ncbi:hypothetical protein [Nonomuraea pusilla]|uniref:Secreted protein n=1 Tax=Nonomuraea pusilla TaxID=46177 RepID=A0A1H7UJL9_9ACTN|nr:hypothetical protein [Nonomuraea pusilla]SEL97232.1 hypothetical protein SAMN05660976_03845 [Nonomuraea pusilla]
MGSRTAISAGVLAVALAAIPAAAPPASASAQDCSRDGGLLSGVTNTLCNVVDTLTDTVDGLTGGATEPVTKGLGQTTDGVLGTVGEALPTSKPTSSGTGGSTPKPSSEPKASSEPKGEPSPTKDGQEREGGGLCLPVLSCDGEGVLGSLTPRPTPDARATQTPRPRDDRRDDGRDADESAVLPTEPVRPTPLPPAGEPQTVPSTRQEVTGEKRPADRGEPQVDLLWPNPFAHELTVPMQNERAVRPSPPASDVLGTVLTIVLLGSAVLATRIVQQRRHRLEPPETIPFEPAPAGSGGRHRLA